MDKKRMVDTQNGILFRHKREWNSDICYNVNKPEGIMLIDTKGHILYKSTNMSYIQ